MLTEKRLGEMAANVGLGSARVNRTWLTEKQIEAIGELAFGYHVLGYTQPEAARALHVAVPLLKKHMDAYLEAHRDSRERARQLSIGMYRRIIREAWRRLDAFSLNSSSQNVSGLLTTARAAQERIDKLTGAEAPIKSEHHTLDLSKLSAADAERFAEIVDANPDTFGSMLGDG